MASGRPTNAEARSFHNRFDNYGDALKRPDYGGPSAPSYSGLDDEPGYKKDHPRYPDYHYPDDKEADTRHQMLRETAVHYGAQPQLQIGDRELDYLMRKKEARALLDFKQFVEDSIPRGTPWAKDYFEKIMPGWYQTKIDIINQKMDIVQKFVEITIRGPQNIDDMFLLYQIYQGNITLPANFQDLITGGGILGQNIAPAQFHSGLYNPKRFVDRKLMISKRNQEYLANFAIPGVDMKGARAPAANLRHANTLFTAPDDTSWNDGNRGDFAAAIGWRRAADYPGGWQTTNARSGHPRATWSYRDIDTETFGQQEQPNPNTPVTLGQRVGFYDTY